MTTDFLWRDRNFNLFWVGQTFSTTGDAFTAVAIPLLLYKSTGSIARMTAITACTAAGAAASSLVAGALVDRVDRRTLLLWTDLGRAFLMASVPLAAFTGMLSFPFLAVVAALMGLLGNTFGIGYVAFVPELVTSARVMAANTRLQGTEAASYVVGPALAGVVVQTWGPETAVGIDALSFLASFASLLAVRARNTTAANAEDECSWATGLARGARFILHLPPLRTVALFMCLEILATAAALDLLTFHLKSALAQSDERVGTMFAVASVGGIAGATLSALVKRRLGMHGAYVATAFALALAFALVTFAGSFAMTALVAVLFTFSSTMRNVLSMTRRQELTPDRLLGRVTAAFWLAISAARVLGAYAVGLVAACYGNVEACQTAAAFLLVLAVATIPARSLNTPAASLADHGPSRP
jgi:MFS family permease